MQLTPEERNYLIAAVEQHTYRHPNARYRPFKLCWDPDISEFRWTSPTFIAINLTL